MDAIAEITPAPTTLGIDQIHDDGNDMRRVPAPAIADAILTSSIKQHGVLEPIGVRPNGNGFRIVFGRRRLRCAIAAGLTQIPVLIRDWTDRDIRAVQAAENMHRQQTHPIDAWRTVKDLVDAGYTIADAATALCLDERETRQMEQLGRLDPELLKLAEIEMPAPYQLRVLANAPHKQQKAALRGVKVTKAPNGTTLDVPWRQIVAACAVDRIPRSRALFDAAKHPDMWREDLFAQPGDDDAVFTDDIARFVKLQRAALAAQVEARRTAKQRVQLAEYDAARGTVALPAGWKLIGGVTEKTRPKKVECIFTAMAADGEVIEVLAEDRAAVKAADKAAAARAKKRDADAPEPDRSDAADDGAAGAEDAPAPAEAAKPGLTKAGLQMVQAAKTAALRQALHEGIAALPLERVVALLVLALAADNVSVRLSHGDVPEGLEWRAQARWRQFRDLALGLLHPGGALTDVNGAHARMMAAAALARLLTVGVPSTFGVESGAAAEWIGAAIGAGDMLGRFDTPAFLAQASGDVLRAAAAAAGIKATGAVGALRERLAGALPDWRPDAAAFGAPAPV